MSIGNRGDEMLLDINVPAWSVTQSTTYTARTNVPGGGLSYINNR